jgi:hypothetical protein
MKRVLPYILIFLVVVNLFAPLSVGVTPDATVTIHTSTAEAANCAFVPNGSTFSPSGQQSTKPTQVALIVKTTGCTGSNYMLNIVLNQKDGTNLTQVDSVTGYVIKQDTTTINFTPGEDQCDDTTGCEITFSINLVSPGTRGGYTTIGIYPSSSNELLYPCAQAQCNYNLTWQDNVALAQQGVSQQIAVANSAQLTLTDAQTNLTNAQTALAKAQAANADPATIANLQQQVTDAQTAVTNAQAAYAAVKPNDDSQLPSCSLFSPSTYVGCLGIILYGLLFKPTSWIFALCGKFFDWTFQYSVSDTAYRSTFVVQGWGIVRDFCNLFFIFVLLYIAFSTILGIKVHGHDAKGLLINVIIIGLLINFSLFTAQLIVDASNIMARVFYNSNTIVINKTGNSQSLNTGDNGEIQLSEAIVNKVDPEELIANSNKVGLIPVKGGTPVTNDTAPIGAGTFLLVVLLATGVNIVGLIVFLYVGLLFISRVIGLWMCMIFAPIAFFSYTVPSMQDIDLIGWKKWWNELLHLSFVAPIFIFFLYLILKFLQTGFNLISVSQGDDGLGLVLSIIVPFIFIMMLLWKAKDFATHFSGKMAESITGGIAAAGGLAIGVATGGAALAGRGIGSLAAKASKGETDTQKYESAKHAMSAAGGHDTSLMRNLTWKQKAKGVVGSKLGLGKVYGRSDGSLDTGIKSGVGGLLNKKQEHIEHIDHDRHDIDAIKDKRYKGTPIAKLSAPQIQNVRDDYVKENKAKFSAEIEEKYRSGDNPTKKAIPQNTALTPDQRKEVNARIAAKTIDDFEHKLKSASEAVGGLSRAFSQVNTGSWHVGNLSQLKSDVREKTGTKVATGLTSFLAGQMRNSILKNAGINHGGGQQKDFLADLKHSLTEALKSTSIKVNVSGGETTGDGHGGGGHGGGGHH